MPRAQGKPDRIGPTPRNRSSLGQRYRMVRGGGVGGVIEAMAIGAVAWAHKASVIDTNVAGTHNCGASSASAADPASVLSTARTLSTIEITRAPAPKVGGSTEERRCSRFAPCV